MCVLSVPISFEFETLNWNQEEKRDHFKGCACKYTAVPFF